MNAQAPLLFPELHGTDRSGSPGNAGYTLARSPDLKIWSCVITGGAMDHLSRKSRPPGMRQSVRFLPSGASAAPIRARYRSLSL